MAEVYETATFYAHFDVLAEGEEPPSATTCGWYGRRAWAGATPPSASPARRSVKQDDQSRFVHHSD